MTLKFILREDRPNNRNEKPLLLRITMNRKTCYIPTNLKLQSQDWNQDKEEIRKSYSQHRRANLLLNKMRNDISEIELDLHRKNSNYSVKNIKELYLKDDSQNTDNVIIFIEQWINQRFKNKEIKIGTVLRYEALARKLREFQDPILIHEFNRELIFNFKAYLKNVKKNALNTISSNLSILRAVANELVKQNLLDYADYPFHNIKLEYEETARRYIDLEDILKIKSLNLKEETPLSKTRDIFLFCLYTGFRIGDALRLKCQDIHDDKIMIIRQKTSDEFTAYLTDDTIKILEKYRKSCQNDSDYLFGIFTKENQSDPVRAFAEQRSATALINKYLKKIQKLTEIDVELSTHCARHSLAVNALENGVPLESIKAILGHKDIHTTQIYAKESDRFKKSSTETIQKIFRN